MITPIYLDIETGPLPMDQIEQFRPEFKAAANLRDPDKIKANIMEKEQAWKADLALSALTARILCVGLLENNQFDCVYGDNNEKLILEDILRLLHDRITAGCQVIGFCSRSFDIPFLIRRSLRHGLKIPFCFFENRYLAGCFVDIAERWACGSREAKDRISLDHLSRFLGTGSKQGNGAEFAGLWEQDRPKALAYLENDLRLTQAAYERLY